MSTVWLYFVESGAEVYELVHFGDRWAADCCLSGLVLEQQGCVLRGGRTVPLTRARIVTE